MHRSVSVLILCAALLVGCAPKPSYSGAIIDPPAPMPDFTLPSADGPVSLSDFGGKDVALFFGYTRCQDVCPTTMANLNYAVQGLGDKADQVQVIFVSVDYQRDTPQTASQYAEVFNPAFKGLSGTKDQIDKVTSELGIYYLFDTPDAQGNYEVEHTSSVLVLNPEGKLVLTWPQGTTAEEMRQDMQTMVGG
jgi:protein SCO1/2